MSKYFLIVLLILSAACQRQKTPDTSQSEKPPYSAQEALGTFELPPGFRIELVASEPEVTDPVAMAFDKRGRLFVAEMPDYPMGKKTGRIRLLEDRDRDGRFERSVVYAQDLHFPNGVMPWKDGVLVTSTPDILYLADTNGDDRADTRTVVLTGFAVTNPQLRVNGLKYGIDNWIYAAYPKVGVPNRYTKEFGDRGTPIRFPGHPQTPPDDIFEKGMDLRFKPDEGKLEPVAGNSQFGNAFDRWGNRFTVWHNNHVRHVVMQNPYFLRNPQLLGGSSMQFLSDHENAATLFPITRQPLHIHESEIGHFTSSCGISVYEGGSFPADYQQSYFVCDPVHNVVHRDVLRPSGPTFVARRGHEGREFLASTDSWFRPVFTSLGPDGSLYIVDFYRKIVEHPEWAPTGRTQEIQEYQGDMRGRIYRVTHGSTRTTANAVAEGNGLPGSDPYDAATLLQQLSSPNMWRRITAQQLLVERQDKSVIPGLRVLAHNPASPEARVHALWTMEGLQVLDPELVLEALDDPSPGVRLNTIRLAEKDLSNPKLRERLIRMVDDPDIQVQFQLACTLGYVPIEQSFEPLQKIAFRHMENSWFQLAVLSVGARHAHLWFRSAIASPSFVRETSKNKEQFLRRITSILGRLENREHIIDVLAAVKSHPDETTEWWRAASLNGLAGGLRRGFQLPTEAERILLGLMGTTLPRLRRSAAQFAAIVELEDSNRVRTALARASRLAETGSGTLEQRVDAITLLAADRTGSFIPLLEKSLAPQQPKEIQEAAANCLVSMKLPRATEILLNRWKSYTATIRESVVAGFFSQREKLPALLDAVAAGKVQPSSLGRPRIIQLRRSPDQHIRKRAEILFPDTPADSRKNVVEKFRPSLQMSGSVERGQQVFAANCAKCHRIGETGFEVGPDLKSLTNRTREDLLMQILDPNLAIASGYEEYEVQTTDGRWITGVMARETATTITLRRGEGEEDTILRTHIAVLRSSSVSQMPENLEEGISIQAMSDLLQFLKSLGKPPTPRVN